MIVRTPRRQSARSAFTLTEMLVVVAIILALAAIAVPITLGVLDSSRRDIAKSQCKGVLKQAVLAYVMDTDAHPDGDALPQSWDEVMQSKKASLAPEALNDPWGHQYHLTVPGSHSVSGIPNEFDIWSDCGGAGDPVGNW